jgi:NAD(P)-dependent dehydrogenase (short-subunit alcohol dehydrogenase family)
MLDGKICVVTGSGGGIGRATAIEMALQGAGGVMVTDVNDDAGHETVQLIREAGGTAEYLRCDVSDDDQLRALMAATAERFGGIDVLHNNAGVQESAFTTDLTIDTLPIAVWDKVYSINLRAVFVATQLAVPYLRASERGPCIINAASLGGLTAFMQCPVYSTTKAGVIMLSKSTAVDLSPQIRCNSYSPGSVMTEMVAKFREAAEDKEALDASTLGSHLIPRFGVASEVAKLVCFLASEDAAFITGENIVIDGGTMAWRGTRS